MSNIATCQCAQLQVVVTGELPPSSMCHCLDCQRRTGSAFGVQVRVPLERAAVTGRWQEFTRTGDSGGSVHFRFCPDCGSTVCWTIPGLPGLAIAAGAFADPGLPPPVRSVYRARKHPWVVIPDSVEADWD